MKPITRTEEIALVAQIMAQRWQTGSKMVKIINGDISPIWRFHAQAAIEALDEVRAQRAGQYR